MSAESHDKLQPIGDRVIIKKDEPKTMTPGGVHIPPAVDQKTTIGTVVAIGNRLVIFETDKYLDALKVGDRVVFGQYAGQEVIVDNEKFLIVRHDELMCKLNEK